MTQVTLEQLRFELRRSIYAWIFFNSKYYSTGLPRWLSGKEPICQCWRHRRHGLGRPPEGGHGSLLQYACLG